MKKLITIILVSILLIASIYGTVYANSIEVTKEKLKESLENLKDDDGTETTLKVSEITDDVIVLKDTETSKVYTLNYTLDGKSQFSIEMTFTKEMTYEEYGEEMQKSVTPIFLFIAIADIAGQDISNAAFYVMFDIVFNENYLKLMGEEENYTDAISILKTNLATDLVINDDLYTYTIKEKSQTENEYVAEVIMDVNTEGDFSIIKEEMDGAVNSISNSIISGFNNIIVNQENVDDTIANINRIPQSGRGFDLVDMLQIVIILAVVAIITLNIYGKVNKNRG